MRVARSVVNGPRCHGTGVSLQCRDEKTKNGTIDIATTDTYRTNNNGTGRNGASRTERNVPALEATTAATMRRQRVGGAQKVWRGLKSHRHSTEIRVTAAHRRTATAVELSHARWVWHGGESKRTCRRASVGDEMSRDRSGVAWRTKLRSAEREGFFVGRCGCWWKVRRAGRWSPSSACE